VNTYSAYTILLLVVSNLLAWFFVYRHSEFGAIKKDGPVELNNLSRVSKPTKAWGKKDKLSPKVNDDDYAWKKENDLDLRS